MVRLFCGYFVVCNYACNSTESGVPQGAGVDGEEGRIAPCPCMIDETILVVPGKRGHCFDGRTICECRSCISGSDSAEGFGGLFLYIDSHVVDLSGMNSNPLTLIDERASRTVAISRLVE